MSTINSAELQSARFAVIYPVARMVLLTRGCVDLKALFEAPWLEYVEGYSTVEEVLQKIEFNHEATALSELVLNQLEQDFGPLTCEAWFPDSDSTNVEWGYAGRIIDAPPAWIGGEGLTPYQISEMWVRRLLALRDGHPDQAGYEFGLSVSCANWRLAPEDDNASI